MLDELNIPNEVRRGIDPTKLLVYMKDQSRVRLAEVSFNDLILISYRHTVNVRLNTMVMLKVKQRKGEV